MELTFWPLMFLTSFLFVAQALTVLYQLPFGKMTSFLSAVTMTILAMVYDYLFFRIHVTLLIMALAGIIWAVENHKKVT